ncbi:hypothetical protein EXIGLDRAFT_143663 [Exidia glandulosa HHB12029]|uniref:F-box domain-containing protein n=1 Tax=Exidia glandulosa HHB12029 TaxID=1314781 RepID=A0A165NBX0_EXIGL|nr:hypothetical protein EXIGLDRAFT_143663 [Exidia glandulosa HHB12029]
MAAAPFVPPELLLHIFGELKAAPRQLATVACASRRFRAIAEPILYDSATLRNRYVLQAFTLTLLRRSDLARLVRALDIDWSTSKEEEHSIQAGFHAFHSYGGAFFMTKSERELAKEGNLWVSNDSPIESALGAAEARNMNPGLRQALRQRTASAQVVVLLDLVPNLMSLVVNPSRIDFWFYGALPSPYDPEKRIPAGLKSLRSLEITYPDHDDDDDDHYAISDMNQGEGYAHVKVISALLLPNLRSLVFVGDEGEEDTWEQYFAENDDDNGYFLDLERLAGASGVTRLDLRDTSLPTSLFARILRMAPALESLRLEQYEEVNYRQLSDVLRQLCLRSIALVEYDLADDDRDEACLPFRNFGELRTLTYLMVPIQALITEEGQDLSANVPASVEELDICFGSDESLSSYTDTIVRFLSQGHCPNLRRFIVRPAIGFRDDIPNMCAAAKIEFRSEDFIEPPLGDGTASYWTSEGEGSEFSGYSDPDEWGTEDESDGDHWEDDDEDEDGLEDEESSEEESDEED